MGSGVALLGSDQTQAKGKGHGKAQTKRQGQVAAQGKGKGAKITICYQTQTRTVKKKGYQAKYPGATLGPCPVVDPPKPQPQPQPACTTWIISGGSNQTAPIVVDDDFSIFRPSKGGAGLLADSDKKASTLNPVVFEAQVGEVLRIVAYDGGGCRSLSPLWLHCAATGQKRELFTGLASPHCNFGAGTFISQDVTVSL